MKKILITLSLIIFCLIPAIGQDNENKWQCNNSASVDMRTRYFGPNQSVFYDKPVLVGTYSRSCSKKGYVITPSLWSSKGFKGNYVNSSDETDVTLDLNKEITSRKTGKIILGTSGGIFFLNKNAGTHILTLSAYIRKDFHLSKRDNLSFKVNLDGYKLTSPSKVSFKGGKYVVTETSLSHNLTEKLNIVNALKLARDIDGAFDSKKAYYFNNNTILTLQLKNGWSIYTGVMAGKAFKDPARPLKVTPTIGIAKSF